MFYTSREGVVRNGSFIKMTLNETYITPLLFWTIIAQIQLELRMSGH